MFKIPKAARIYFFLAAFCLLLPALMSFYKGETGRFIVSTGKLQREPFRHSVVFINQHSLEGAIGFVINKPLPVNDFKGAAFLKKADIPFFWGGPVEYPDQIFILEKIEIEPFVKVETLKNLQKNKPKIFLEIKKSILADEGRYKVVVGYSGWTILQLESEFRRGNWAAMNVDIETVFSNNLEQDKSWKVLLSKASKTRPLKETKVF